MNFLKALWAFSKFWFSHRKKFTIGKFRTVEFGQDANKAVFFVEMKRYRI